MRSPLPGPNRMEPDRMARVLVPLTELNQGESHVLQRVVP